MIGIFKFDVIENIPNSNENLKSFQEKIKHIFEWIDSHLTNSITRSF